MDIYLVRISERSDNSLFVERKPNATTDDDYIAISHVWGTPETIKATEVDGVGTVYLSPGKKGILSILRGETVCGEGWFWMDLFCIDQTEGASISIADQLMAIPAIYKSSRCVKVLIETPVCESWQVQASHVIADPTTDSDLLTEEELRHARKCPHMLFCDPWFERLWTRQEGLYGSVLEVVLLNPISCPRLQSQAKSGRDGRIAEGTALAKRTIAESFFVDKIAYHGIPVSEVEAERIQRSLYLDFVYRHRVDIERYGGQIGPAPSYSPISEAWRSGRITTKPRDYVLAVFPDISGYQVPINARKMPFHELVANALGQLAVRERFHIAPKIPKGLMMAISSKESVNSWMPKEPTSITEAFDSFIARVSDEPKTATDAKFFAVAHRIRLEELDFSRSNISEIKDLWRTTADIVKHMTYVSPSGPCTGTRNNVQTEQGLLHQYFVHQFATLAVEQYLPKAKLNTLQLATTGVLTFDKVESIPGDVFSHELRRFLVSLICGTSLHTADIILESAHFRLVSSEYGKLLALLRRDILCHPEQEDFMLIGNTLWPMQGFLIGLNTDKACFMIGRTAIPTSKFWDNIQIVKQ